MTHFRLIDAGWGRALVRASQKPINQIRFICPFIKEATIRRLLKNPKVTEIQIITRFNLADFYSGVSDLSALEFLLTRRAKVRGVKNLHSKLYLFGGKHAFVTSANLTECALERNHEFGFEANDSKIFKHCLQYFDGLWKRAGSNLLPSKLQEWSERVTALQACANPQTPTIGLEDYGADAGLPIDLIALSPPIVEARQAFIKFFGRGDNRARRSYAVADAVKSAGCHRACTYPRGKRPRQVSDGAIIFMARLVKNPPDIIIFGRGIALAHVEGRDDATPADIKLKHWKERWPHYIRVHHTEFMDGALGDGVSLSEMMSKLKSNAFASTQRNKAAGRGNTELRRAYMRQAAVELSTAGLHWLSERLEAAFAKNGKLSQSFMSALDWPDAPTNRPRS